MTRSEYDTTLEEIKQLQDQQNKVLYFNNYVAKIQVDLDFVEDGLEIYYPLLGLSDTFDTLKDYLSAEQLKKGFRELITLF